MALGILGAMGVVGSSEDSLFVSELSLDGSLRQSLEERTVTLARSDMTLTFQAGFMLVGTYALQGGELTKVKP